MLLGLVVCATRSHFMPLKPLSQNEPVFCFSLPENHCNENNFSNQQNKFIMDIIAIESKTFGQMKERFEDFFNQVRSLCGDNQDKEQWLGNDDVCKLLQISLRTLQSYRDNGILPYSQIGRKCYYRVSDIENLVSQSQINKEQQ